jgi:putative transposase
MVRLARVVAPGIPHHITQRGNRRQATFFCAEDYQAYIALMGEWCRACAVEVWAYCLMPNHVHLIAAPDSEDGLRRAIGEAHRRYTRRVNFREGWRGHLWQGRFTSCPMDEPYLLTAARYIEQNPVRAGLAARPWEYPWSSASAHVAGRDDVLVTAAPLLKLVGNWEGFLSLETSEEAVRRLRRHERSGRPLGDEPFTAAVERQLHRTLRRGKPGPRAAELQR